MASGLLRDWLGIPSGFVWVFTGEHRKKPKKTPGNLPSVSNQTAGPVEKAAHSMNCISYCISNS